MVSEVLDKAAGVIERNGWHQGEFYQAGSAPEPNLCKVCAGGAINVAGGEDPDREYAEGSVRAARQAFAERIDPETVAEALRVDGYLERDELIELIGGWNDQDHRTAEQVVAELRAAAAAEREVGR